jgi:hypothetical protein
MNGLLRRLTRRRAAPADEIPAVTPAASEPVDASAVTTAAEPLSAEQQEEHARQEEAARERRAREEERMRRERDVPAGLDPAEVEAPLDSGARRGRMRRRLRYLRHSREILLRDLGGFFYEVHRTAGGHQSSGHRTILETKTGRLAAIDTELRELESRLGEPLPGHTIVREPGIGGTCAVCGELHGSEAHFCSHCGAPLSEQGVRQYDEAVDRTIAARDAPPEVEAEGEAPVTAPAPEKPARRFGWPRRRPTLEPDPADPPTAATDETVALKPVDGPPAEGGGTAESREASAESREPGAEGPEGREASAERREPGAERRGDNGTDPSDTRTFAERRS